MYVQLLSSMLMTFIFYFYFYFCVRHTGAGLLPEEGRIHRRPIAQAQRIGRPIRPTGRDQPREGGGRSGRGHEGPRPPATSPASRPGGGWRLINLRLFAGGIGWIWGSPVYEPAAGAHACAHVCVCVISAGGTYTSMAPREERLAVRKLRTCCVLFVVRVGRYQSSTYLYTYKAPIERCGVLTGAYVHACDARAVKVEIEPPFLRQDDRLELHYVHTKWRFVDVRCIARARETH